MATVSGKARGAILLVLFFAVLALKGALIAPPGLPPTVSAGAFDTDRAIGRLARILGDQRPHPVDSVAGDAVRARLLAELRAIGLSPVVREASDCNGSPRSRVISCTRTRNVVASFGPATGPALLLNSHYDSTPAGPGAADDGIGVATMIEIAHLLRGEALARPIVLLFNEGEEYGLNGASAFLATDPVAQRVGALINIEARGVSGPALMFETSSPNGPAIAAYARATRRPFANSIMTDMATLIPNSTDVVVFKDRGWQTLNYSIIGNETRYHSPGDTIAALDRASVHHMGSEVLAATRLIASGSAASAPSGGRAVFADVAGRVFFSLPLTIAIILFAGLFIAALMLAWRGKALGRALAVMAGAFAAAIGAAWLASAAAAWLRPGDYFRAFPLVTYLACYATVIAAALAVIARWGRAIDARRLRLAGWALTMIVFAIAASVLPGALIFMLGAPALALAGLALETRWSAMGAGLRWAAIALQLLVFAELLAMIELLLVDGPIWAPAPVAALAALPVLVEARAIGVRWIGIGALVLWAAALLIPRASGERPGQYAVDYVRDDIKGTTHWAIATNQAALPAGLASLDWRMAKLPTYGRARWTTPAPVLPLAKPRVTVVAMAPAGTGRVVRLALDRGGSDTITIRLPKEVRVIAAGLAGKPRAIDARAPAGPSALRCSGRGCDGLTIDLRFADRRPVKAELVGVTFALPREGAPLVAARPADAHAQYSPDASVRRTGVRF